MCCALCGGLLFSGTFHTLDTLGTLDTLDTRVNCVSSVSSEQVGRARKRSQFPTTM